MRYLVNIKLICGTGIDVNIYENHRNIFKIIKIQHFHLLINITGILQEINKSLFIELLFYKLQTRIL